MPGPDRQGRRGFPRQRLVIALVVVVLLAGTGATLSSLDVGSSSTRLGSLLPLSAADPGARANEVVPPSPAVPPADLTDERVTIATARTSDVRVYSQPDANASLVAVVATRTAYGWLTTFAVDSAQAAPRGWLPVTVPLVRPNGTSGWVRTTDVTTSRSSHEIRVSLTNHALVLLQDGVVVLETKVIIGAPTTSTPVGRFFVTDPFNCNTASVPSYPVAQCSDAYGDFAIGTSALSEALDSFAGTIPQIAIHGTNLPSSELGKDLSNGCIRIPNSVVVQLAALAPLRGIPVVITP